MITIEEIPVERIDEFWDIHFAYLIQDEIITEEEDKEYFGSEEYRGIIKEHMLRERDRHHMIYFVEDGVRIGAAQYNTYQSEDGKCFVLDFWVFPEYRGNGAGHRCFAALEQYTKKDGARYYEINCEKENAHRFWESNGFVDAGVDEYGMPLMMKKREFVYHGSPCRYEVLVPHQAYDTGFAAGCQNAVYATTNKNMAIAFALGAVPDENGEVERTMMPEYGDKMVFSKGHPNYGGKGYLYVLDKADFVHAMGSQWVCFSEVKPIEVLELNVDEHLDLCVVEEKC